MMSRDSFRYSQEHNKLVKSVSQEKWKLWLAVGLSMILGGAYLLYKHKNKHPNKNKIQELKRLIDKSFPIAQPNLSPLTPQKNKSISDQNLTINIHYISQLENKNRSNLSSTRNPFLPPFQKGLMIVQLPPKHRLLYNKFYFYKYHLLIVTQQFQEQTNRLSVQDFKQTTLVAQTIDGLFFYNCGPESGFSQKHKHMQVLPKEAFKLPIVASILSDIKNKKLQKIRYNSSTNIPIHLFKSFQFVHGIVIMPQNIGQQSFQQAAIEFKKAEDTLFTHLSLLLKNNKFSYNIIGCSSFLMMIPRKSQKVMNQIGANAIIFMGSMLIKDPKLFDKIQFLWKPSKILQELTYTQIPK